MVPFPSPGLAHHERPNRYLDAIPWRVLRTLLKADPTPVPFKDARPWRRRDKDEATFAQLVELGLVVVAGRDAEGEALYRITERGKAAADLGEVHPEPARPKANPKAAGRAH